jgi:hypothetical protein
MIASPSVAILAQAILAQAFIDSFEEAFCPDGFFMRSVARQSHDYVNFSLVVVNCFFAMRKKWIGYDAYLKRTSYMSLAVRIGQAAAVKRLMKQVLVLENQILWEKKLVLENQKCVYEADGADVGAELLRQEIEIVPEYKSSVVKKGKDNDSIVAVAKVCWADVHDEMELSCDAQAGDEVGVCDDCGYFGVTCEKIVGCGAGDGSGGGPGDGCGCARQRKRKRKKKSGLEKCAPCDAQAGDEVGVCDDCGYFGVTCEKFVGCGAGDGSGGGPGDGSGCARQRKRKRRKKSGLEKCVLVPD